MTDLLERRQWTIPPLPRESRRDRSIVLIACAGALAYSSWPLAFLVNPPLAGTALASSFEGRGQPFSWLFVLLDCFTGLCAAIVSVRRLLVRHGGLRPERTVVLALLGYGAFGVVTAVDALVPLNCGSTSIQSCAGQLWPITPDDLLTGVALLALFIASATVVVQLARRSEGFHRSTPVTITVTITLIAWSALGLLVLFGSISANAVAVCQYAFLTLTGILAFVVPLSVTSTQRRSTVGIKRSPGRVGARSRHSHRPVPTNLSVPKT